MIRSVKIRNYKSLQHLDLTLEKLSVLIGPNSAGKSNFLDALQLLSRLVCTRSLKEAFEAPYRGRPQESFSFTSKGIEDLLLSEESTFSIEADIELSPYVVDAVNKQIIEMRRGVDVNTSGKSQGPRTNYIHHKRLRYRIEVGIKPATGMLFVCDEYLTALDRDWMPRSKPQPFLQRKADRIHLRMEGQSHPTYIDRRLDHTIASRPHYPPHYPHLTALRQELESWWFYYFEPRERMRAATSVKEVRHIGLMGENLPAFLNTLQAEDPKQFESINKSIYSLIPSIKGVKTDVDKFGEVELSVTEGEISMPARVISEGTLRILGLLALGGVKEPPALIGFEEPENGVQPRRIKDIAKILENRSKKTQMIVTTHSPVLADHLPESSLFVCQKNFGKTTIAPFTSWGSLAKRQSVDDALEDSSESLPISERMLRGDFDA